MQELYSPLAEPGTYDVLPGAPDVRQVEHPSLGKWVNFRKTLRPRYGIVWYEIAICSAMMIGGFAVHIALTRIWGNLVGLEVGVVFALWIGFWLNALLTFGHEAAHYNLSPIHARNDLLADWTIWLFFPQSTKSYRRSHWQHHLHLGDLRDTEISYRNCLSPWFLARAVTGIYLLELASRYIFQRRSGQGREAESKQEPWSMARVVPLVRVVAVHSMLVTVAVLFHAYASALVWTVGAIFVFPVFASTRQILEHRAAEAACSTDFGRVPHGPVNRIFGTDVFSRFFGAAGFNRHLLHHWDPTVSYTRFDEMETFLGGTGLRTSIQAARSSYASTFVALIRQSRDAAV